MKTLQKQLTFRHRRHVERGAPHQVHRFGQGRRRLTCQHSNPDSQTKQRQKYRNREHVQRRRCLARQVGSGHDRYQEDSRPQKFGKETSRRWQRLAW